MPRARRAEMSVMTQDGLVHEGTYFGRSLARCDGPAKFDRKVPRQFPTCLRCIMRVFEPGGAQLLGTVTGRMSSRKPNLTRGPR